MCSIAGCVRNASEAELRLHLEQMNALLAHRGPDGSGIYTTIWEGLCIGFTHNRLAILDLSNAAAQPFHFEDQLVMVYNGEIYNYKEIRQTLIQKGYTFKTSGDTEVVLAAYHAYGNACLDHFDGMFAFAILNKQTRTIFCARDRFGEKPFYFQQDEQLGFRFASELLALLDTGSDAHVDETMLYHYLTHGFTKIPNQPWKTFYKHIFQLPPAHALTYSIADEHWEMHAYWDLDKETITDQLNAVEQFTERLSDSVNKRLRADVAIGTSLSGGLDSSVLAALISNEINQFQTFSAVFPGFTKDESSKIQQVVTHLGLTSHTVSPDDDCFVDRIESLVFHHREPIGSASVLAQHLVYEKAAEMGVKVILDGQGADESLAGYKKYTHWYLQELIQTVGWKEANRQAKAFQSNHLLDQWSWKNRIASYLPSITALQLEKKVLREQHNCQWMHPDFTDTAKDRMSIQKPIVEKLNDIQYHDLMVMGLEELLRYADRNAMAHGVEVRMPFLAHELVQFVLCLPSSYRMREGYTKWILRESMKHQLPQEIIWQQNKIGFETPQEHWMESERVKEMTQSAWHRLNQLNITRLTRKPLTTTERFRLLVAGSLLA